MAVSHLIAICAQAGGLPPVATHALPQNPTVQAGGATFSTQGSRLTIQTTDRALINWSSFNIGTGASTVFIQPTSTSVVWNHINDPNPSQILGHLDANGYVILQNQSGFYVGGDAVINAAGFIMTTTPAVPQNIWSGGAWDFNAPPPTASIINYGQINTPGGQTFLIAHNIENHGTITAPGGNIGLYAGKEVLVSPRPDGRGVSATVKLPEGSVDNSGNLIADAGTIALHAQVVNQGGMVQANSVREKNGAIEFVASDAVNLGATSLVEAKGDANGVSAGGHILIKSDAAFTDKTGSKIDVAGGAQGGNGGQVEISAAKMSAIQSGIDGSAVAGWKGGQLSIDPDKIVLTSPGDPAPPSGTVNPGDPPSAGSLDTLTLDVSSFASFSQINLQANKDIELQSQWTLSDRATASTLNLTAGRNITLDANAGIIAGNNWTLNLTAGTELTSAANRQAGTDGIYLLGGSFVQSKNGGINLFAGNEILVNSGESGLTGNNGIRTLAGGSINATAIFGDINSGANPHGYVFRTRGTPLYTVSPVSGGIGTLGGISTAAGGDVNLFAGGNISSYLPVGTDKTEAGSGAFGPQPGNLTITALGSVFGHYVVANGTGNITAENGDVGGPEASRNVALSLVKGSWNVQAPNGSIYLQEVRNPNGTLNDANGSAASAAYHLFDYDPADSVSLNAGDSVFITGLNRPRTTTDLAHDVPILFPPSLSIVAGQDIVLNNDVTLFPSALGNVHLTAGHDFLGEKSDGSGAAVSLQMSDSASHRWASSASFTSSDHAPVPPELNNSEAVTINVGHDLDKLFLTTTKKTEITVGHDMNNTSFVGENLHPGDTTFINVAGNIANANPFHFVILPAPIINVPGVDPLHPSTWFTALDVALDPARIASIVLPQGILPNLRASYIPADAYIVPPGSGSLGFIYNPVTLRLWYNGVMPEPVRQALEKPLTILRYGPDGFPMVDAAGHFVTTTFTFANPASIEALYQQSLKAPPPGQLPPAGYQIGGPGVFNITAKSIDLGNTAGIVSLGVWGNNLAPYTSSGAEVNVTLSGDLNMFASTIASIYGGNINVTSTGGELDLGSADLFNNDSRYALGIYTAGHSDVNVIALKNINIDGSRIAAYNGGNIFVKSFTGNVDVGSGGTTYANVQLVNYTSSGQLGSTETPIFGSGLVATTVPRQYQTVGGSPIPGNIIVETPQGSIFSSKAGILQLALDGNTAPGSVVSLTAGSPGYIGNIDLGDSGVIGGTVNLTATGDIHGLVVSRQNANINAAQNFSGTVLSAGSANLSAGGSISGTVIGIGGVNASGSSITANLVSQNVSANGAQANTLGAQATATSTSTGASTTANQNNDRATTDLTQNGDDLNKKANRPLLSRTIGRVTVLLPNAQ